MIEEKSIGLFYFFAEIQKLVLAGKLGEAIKTVKQLYPGLLEKNRNLLFMLRVRQFIEMVNGTDTDVELESVNTSSPQPTTTQQTPLNTSKSSSPDTANWTNGKAEENIIPTSELYL